MSPDFRASPLKGPAWRGVFFHVAFLLILPMFVFPLAHAEQILKTDFNSPVQQGRNTFIHWDMLNLNPAQYTEIQRLDMTWRKIYWDLYPQVQQDKSQLHRMLHDPKAREQDVMELRARIDRNEERLHNEATWTFLCKKKLLTEQQRQQLHQLMGE